MTEPWNEPGCPICETTQHTEAQHEAEAALDSDADAYFDRED